MIWTKRASFLEKCPCLLTLLPHLALPRGLRQDSPWPFSPGRGRGAPGETEAGKGILEAGFTDEEIKARKGEGNPGRVSPLGRTGLCSAEPTVWLMLCRSHLVIVNVLLTRGRIFMVHWAL